MRRAPTVVALAAAAALLATSPATAADDGGTDLVSGVEGTKAALVRIETSVIAEIVHINHSTGDVELLRGRYTVPLDTGTGVYTSADGVIVTSGRTVEIDQETVSVSSANQLFTDQLGLTLTGNDGDMARRATTNDRFWSAHLTHCYDRVEHCVLFTVPEYTVIPYTGTPTRVQADLIGAPDGPGGVAVLRIAGGGGTPTAELAGDGEAAPADALLAGFDQPPAAGQPPVTLPVRTAEGSDQLTAEGNLPAALAAGMSGGPVVDPETGRLVGLATTAEDGTPSLVPVADVRTALDAAGAPPSASAFDAVFRRGVDHLAGGASGGAAASAFQESLTYYDSALAAQHLQTAQAQGQGAGAASDTGDEGPLSGTTGWAVLAGALLLAALLAALVVRRGRARRPAAGRGGGGAGRPARAGGRAPDPVPATAAGGQVPPTTTAAAPRSGRGPAPDGAGRSAADLTTAAPRVVPVAVPPPARAGSDPSTGPAAGAAWARVAAPAGESPGFCSDCGKGLRAGARFCGACGARVG
ncbi:trypsin-like peptidase domain-containing protein [Geodermatophilus sp. SYSU D00079]